MRPRLLADENTSHRMVSACCQFQAGFPLIHISDWQEGAYLSVKDPALLMTLREAGMVLVSFDRASLPLHAGNLTREGLGHAGLILFRRSVPALAYGKQARLLVDFWREAANWDWPDRIEYLPTSLSGGSIRCKSGFISGMKFWFSFFALMVLEATVLASEEAPVTAALADMHGGIKSTLDQFSNDCGRYPTTAEGFKAMLICPTNLSGK